jgi:hypothetical protein
VIKAQDSRIVVKASFAGKERVLKIAILDEGIVEANVLAGQWIRRLGLKGVTAPEMDICRLGPGDLDMVIAKAGEPDLKGQIDKKISQAKTSIEKGEVSFAAAMVSEPVQGKTGQELLGTGQNGFFENLVRKAVLEETPGKGTVTQKTLVEKIKQVRTSWDRGEPIKQGNQQVNDVKDPTKQRITNTDLEKLTTKNKLYYLDQLVNMLEPRHSPTKGDFVLENLDLLVNELSESNVDEVKAVEQVKAKFELQVLLEQLGGRLAAQAVDAVRKMQKPIEAYQAWLSNDEGRDAFIRMAAADVIVGMYDRLLSTLNVQNFMFTGDNKPQLVCIDNAKQGGPFLGEKNPREDYQTWFNNRFLTLAGKLAETLQGHLEKMGVDGAELVTPERVAEILQEVANSAIAASKAGGDGAEEIRRRAKYVLDRATGEDALVRVLQVTPIEASQSGLTKIQRKVKRMFAFTKQAKEREKGVNTAHDLKVQARKADPSQIDKLIQDSEKQLGAVGDAESKAKAELELKAKKFISELNQATDAQEKTLSYIPSQKTRAAVDKLVQQWTSSKTKQGRDIEDAYNAWLAAVQASEGSKSTATTTTTTTATNTGSSTPTASLSTTPMTGSSTQRASSSTTATSPSSAPSTSATTSQPPTPATDGSSLSKFVDLWDTHVNTDGNQKAPELTDKQATAVMNFVALFPDSDLQGVVQRIRDLTEETS